MTTYGTGLGELSGRVVDDGGQPIRGASVSAIGSTYANGEWRPSIVGTARTDDRGEYTLANLEAGQYRLVADATGPATYAGFFPAAPTLAAAQPVTLRRGEGLVGLNVTARRTAMPAVSGMVVSASGARLAHAMVTLANVDWPARTYQATADATGVFKLPPVSAGRYHLWARGPSTPDSRAEIGRMTITLDRASAEPVTLRTSAGATLAGTVTLEGVMAPDDRRGLRLVAVAVNPDPGAPTLKLQSPISDDGRFAIAGVFGRRVLRADGLPSGWFVKAVQADGVTVTDAALDVSGKPPASLQLVLSNRSAEIRGQVLDASGGILTSGSVVVFPDDPQAWQYPSRFVKLGAVQPSGTFRVTGLPPGRYLVAARVSAGRFWDAPESLAALRAGAAKVTIDRPGAASITARIVAATSR